MSGHSHWSTIKRQKSAGDQKRSKIFSKLSRVIKVAVQEGGGNTDAETNSALRLAIEKANEANMPKANIKKAIERGAGQGRGGKIENIVFGGFILRDVALIIQTGTDNRNRTTAEIRNILESQGGSLASQDAAEPYFEKIGLIQIPADKREKEDYLNLALKIGAEDFEIKDKYVYFYTKSAELSRVIKNLQSREVEIVKSGLQMRAKITILVKEKDKKKLVKILEELEDHEDVVKVYSNADFFV